ncbi:MAG: diguanylate cyclase [Terracidiphilus sp.]
MLDGSTSGETGARPANGHPRPAPRPVLVRSARLFRLWLRVSLIVCLAFALAPARQVLAQTFSFQTFGQQQGLSNLGINAIAAGADGRFWVATQYGLFLFDGVSFTRMHSVEPDESPFISALYLDSHQRLWFTDEVALYFRDRSGIHKVDARNLGFGYGDPPQFASLADDSQTVYFTGGGKLRRAVLESGGAWRVEDVFSSSEKARLPQLNDIHSVAARNGSELWMGCGQALCQLAQGKMRVWGEKDGVSARTWTSLFVDRAGKLWARGSNRISVLDPGSQVFHRDEAGLPPHSLDAGVSTFVQDRSGRVITALANGIALRGAHGWRPITTRNGFPHAIVNVLFVDPHGALWMGLTGPGLVHWLGYPDWEGWTADNGLSNNNVWSFALDRRGRLWVGTESNLELLKPGADRFVPVRPTNGKPIAHVLTLMAAPDGRIWSGSGDGNLIVYNPDNQRSIAAKVPKDLFHLFADHTGRVWLCSGDGVWFVDPSPGAPKLTPVRAGPPIVRGEIFDGVESPSGVLWFVGDRNIFRYDRHTWSVVPLAENLRIEVYSQLAAASDGTLWLTVAGRGVVHLRFDGARLQPVPSPRELESSSRNVVLLHFDRRGWLWAGTDNGVDIFNGVRWRHVSRDDGLVWNDTDSNAFLSAPDGSVWIGTSGGIAHILQPQQLFQDQPLSATLSRARLGNQPLGNQPLALAGSTVLPWKNLPLTLHLSVSDLSRAHAVQYRYRLAGLETDWTRTAEPEVRYPSLPPGAYRFEVYAVDLDHGALTPMQTLSFRILAPWWQRPWFYALSVLAGLGLAAALVALLWRWRHKVLLRRQRYLEELVAARTRDLAQLAIHDSLTGLLNRAATFELLAREMERARRGNGPLALVLADLDHFKLVNDRHGHPAGDAVLVAFCRRVEKFLRPYDGFGRYGGEEFLLIVPGIGLDNLLQRLDQLRRAIECEGFEAKGFTLNVTCSFGVAMLAPEDISPASFIERVDAALYRAKRGGRNQVCCQEEEEARGLSPVE